MNDPSLRIYTIITDYARSEAFFPGVIDSKVAKRERDILWVYQRLRFPGSISDREFVIRVVNHPPDPEGSYFWVEWHLDRAETLKLSGLVLKAFSGFLELRALACQAPPKPPMRSI